MAARGSWVCKELSRSLRLAWLIAISYALTSSLSFVSLAFCGHVGDSTSILQAAGLALSVIKLSGIAVAVGIVSTLDTLATQAWGGGNHKKVGIYLQRGIIILCLAVCVVLGIWFNAESILNLLQQPPEVVTLSVQYIQVFSCALPAVFLFLLLRTYLQAQNITYPFLFTGICGNIVNAVAHYLFLFVAGWGIRGAAAALALTWYSLLFSLLIIIYVRKLHVKTWGGWSRECLLDWGQFARFSVLGLVMVIVEWITFEVGFFIGGLIGNVQQAIHSLLSTCMYVLFAIPKALAMTTAVRVGNELGSGNHAGAKRAVLVNLALGAVWLLFIASALVGLKPYVPMIFTADQEVLQAMGPIMYAAAGVVLGDGLQGILGGVIRGSGRQSGGAAANFVSFWIVCIPVGVVLVFVARLHILGFWLGLVAGEVTQVIIYGIIVLSIRWKKQAAQAHARATEKLARQRSSPLSHKPMTDEVSPLIDPTVKLSAGYRSIARPVSAASLNGTYPEHVPSIWYKDEVEESLVENSSDSHKGNPSPALKIAWSTVVLRVVTCTVFALFLLVGVALSQLCVYRCTVNARGDNSSTNMSFTFGFFSNVSNASTPIRYCYWDGLAWDS